MLTIRNAVIAVLLTMFVSSVIPYDNPLGLALKVGLFQMVGGAIGIGFLLLLRHGQTPIIQTTND